MFPVYPTRSIEAAPFPSPMTRMGTVGGVNFADLCLKFFDGTVAAIRADWIRADWRR
jgi:hypothetical protein